MAHPESKYEKCSGCGAAIDVTYPATEDEVWFVGKRSRVSGDSLFEAIVHWLWNFPYGNVEKTFWCTDCVTLSGE